MPMPDLSHPDRSCLRARPRTIKPQQTLVQTDQHPDRPTEPVNSLRNAHAEHPRTSTAQVLKHG
jgi:hypothetical protein